MASPERTHSNSRAPLVPAKVIADHYSVCERSILRWKDKGLIPFVQVERVVRFDFAAVVAAIEGKKD